MKGTTWQYFLRYCGFFPLAKLISETVELASRFPNNDNWITSYYYNNRNIVEDDFNTFVEVFLFSRP